MIGQVAALNGLANVLRRLDRPLEEVASLYQQALTLAEELTDKATHAGILNGLGLTLYGQGGSRRLMRASPKLWRSRERWAIGKPRPLYCTTWVRWPGRVAN
ncbi:MAG: tetratricopeptide repeat protein [Anaerolineae bacterium]|nr:MAG: tetratricopeptide repeat protein [Anaerolineae bacterium]